MIGYNAIGCLLNRTWFYLLVQPAIKLSFNISMGKCCSCYCTVELLLWANFSPKYSYASPKSRESIALVTAHVCLRDKGPVVLVICRKQQKENWEDTFPYLGLSEDNIRVSVNMLKLSRCWVMKQDLNHPNKSTTEWFQIEKAPVWVRAQTLS